VTRGVSLIEQAARTMEEIVEAVREVTGQLSRITQASSEQLAGIRQVADAVTQMEQATQQNADLVEQSARSAERMTAQAGQLMAAVSRFQLPQAGAAEGAPAPASENLGRVIGETRSLAAHEGHVPRVRPALEAIHHVGQAG
jgi:ABC-type transporter Mla subunit MlaD